MQRATVARAVGPAIRLISIIVWTSAGGTGGHDNRGAEAEPVLRDSCANWGMRMKAEYKPAPIRNAAVFVVHTPRTRIIFMSTNGLELRVSTATTIRTRAVRREQPSVFGDPTPRRGLADASSAAEIRRHEERGAPVHLAGYANRGLGTKRQVNTARRRSPQRIQNSQCS